MTKRWVIVPVKCLGQAKQRLAQVLNKAERASLMLAMLEDVLSVLINIPEIEGITLVSRSVRVKELGRSFNIETYEESTNGDQSSAITEAAEYVASSYGATRMLTLSADIPGFRQDDVQALLQQTEPIVLVPDRQGTGTSAVLADLPLTLRLQFGESSLHKHMVSGFPRPVLFHNQSIARDIDTVSDIKEALHVLPDCATRQFLINSGIAVSISAKLIEYEEALVLANETNLDLLCKRAVELRNHGHGNILTYSRKVFIPLTQLCRNVCHYCAFAQSPSQLEQPYLPLSEIIEIARKGAESGCKEALFTLGDKPELRYRVARVALMEMGFNSTLDYLKHAAEQVHAETGLLPHLNLGVLSAQDIHCLRPVAPSIGLMLESVSDRLCEKTQPHYGSPDKLPVARLTTIENAGKYHIPTSTGILIGIGETRLERVESLLALRDLHQRFGHLQEIIVQNFRAKAGTKMASYTEPDEDELIWTVAVARILFGPKMNIQVPPNLNPNGLRRIIDAGINDFGGISPITPDFVNPEAPWPQISSLEFLAEERGMQLKERLCIYPEYIQDAEVWTDKNWLKSLYAATDEQGKVRDNNWFAGGKVRGPYTVKKPSGVDPKLQELLDRTENGDRLDSEDIVELFRVDDSGFDAVVSAADQCRQNAVGEDVSYIVNCNINYTNICELHCHFCAFSKGKPSNGLRGVPYLMSIDDIQVRTRKAFALGATEICLQGGIHPAFTGETYLEILTAVKDAAPGIHVHGFSPQEVRHGAKTLGLTLEHYLDRLIDAGLDSLPGTAAEILNNNIRARLCPDKLSTQEWLRIIETAHANGLSTTATIMFGHIEHAVHWAEHLLLIRDIQSRSKGFTEFVPLPFIHQKSPLYLRRYSRKGPTWREAILMHAVARLVLHGQIDNVQTSWVKMGRQGTMACLNAGSNDLGGTLMSESISKAAGTEHGEKLTPDSIKQFIALTGRNPRQRNTLYANVEPDRPYTDFHTSAQPRSECKSLSSTCFNKDWKKEAECILD